MNVLSHPAKPAHARARQGGTRTERGDEPAHAASPLPLERTATARAATEREAGYPHSRDGSGGQPQTVKGDSRSKENHHQERQQEYGHDVPHFLYLGWTTSITRNWQCGNRRRLLAAQSIVMDQPYPCGVFQRTESEERSP
jgi:hypothetical protein